MNATLVKYNAARVPLEAVLTLVPSDRWTTASPCEGWTAHDVLGHMIDTQREFFTGRGHDMDAPPEVEADPVAAWRDHARQVALLVGDDHTVAGEYDGHFGPTTTGKTFEQFYVWDMLVHRWDIATAAGLDARFTDEELDDIERGMGSFGEALYMDGICKPGKEPVPDSDRTARVLAKLGRRA